MDDRDMDLVMKSRFSPVAPAGMAARIMNAAREIEQEKPRLSKEYVFALIEAAYGEVSTLIEDALYIPRPAYALASVIAFGFVLGIYGADISAGAALSTQDLSSYMMIEDRFVATEFLSEVH